MCFPLSLIDKFIVWPQGKLKLDAHQVWTISKKNFLLTQLTLSASTRYDGLADAFSQSLHGGNAMITFYGQPKFANIDSATTASGYELLIRQQVDGRWLLPEDFTALPPDQFEFLLRKALLAIPPTITRVSFNLERVHFVNPQFLEMVQRVQADTDVTLTVELTERYDPNIENLTIVHAAKAFFDAGIEVVVDDVGSGNNLPGLVEALTPYVVGYKFGIQNLRPYATDADLRDRLDFWAKQAERKHKRFEIAGVESLDDVENTQAIPACSDIQGYYFGQPVPLSTEDL